MSNYCILGDVHLKIDNVNFFELFFDRFPTILKKFDIKRVIFLGDIYENRGIIRAAHQRSLIRALSKIVKAGCNVDILVGNHDLDNLAGTFNNSLDVIPLVFGSKVRVHSENLIENGEMYIPYVTNLEQTKRFIEAQHDVKVAFCHLSVSEFYLNKGLVDYKGLPPNIFDQVQDYTFVGHLHIPQMKGKIIFPGGLSVHSFSEAGMVPKIYVYDDEMKKVSTLPVSKIVPEMPLYFELEIGDGEQVDVRLNDSVPFENNCVKFILKGKTMTECNRLRRDILHYLEGMKCSPYFKNVTEKEVKERLPENLTLVDMFLKYIDQEKYKNKRDDLMALGKSYLEKLSA